MSAVDVERTEAPDRQTGQRLPAPEAGGAGPSVDMSIAAALSDPGKASPTQLLDLQRSVGNRSVVKMLSAHRRGIQRAPGDDDPRRNSGMAHGPTLDSSGGVATAPTVPGPTPTLGAIRAWPTVRPSTAPAASQRRQRCRPTPAPPSPPRALPCRPPPANRSVGRRRWPVRRKKATFLMRLPRDEASTRRTSSRPCPRLARMPRRPTAPTRVACIAARTSLCTASGGASIRAPAAVRRRSTKVWQHVHHRPRPDRPGSSAATCPADRGGRGCRGRQRARHGQAPRRPAAGQVEHSPGASDPRESGTRQYAPAADAGDGLWSDARQLRRRGDGAHCARTDP